MNKKTQLFYLYWILGKHETSSFNEIWSILPREYAAISRREVIKQRECIFRHRNLKSILVFL